MYHKLLWSNYVLRLILREGEDNRPRCTGCTACISATGDVSGRRETAGIAVCLYFRLTENCTKCAEAETKELRKMLRA